MCISNRFEKFYEKTSEKLLVTGGVLNMRFASHISWQKVHDRIFIIDEICNSIIKIEDLAMEIWCMLAEEMNTNDIIDSICNNYCVNKDIVSQDVNEFLINMMEKGYLVRI